MPTPHSTACNRYARDVVSGKILACEYARQACQRHLDDLEKSKQRRYPYRFNRDLADRACRFIEKLPHTKGRWAREGQKIKLEPWQKFIVCNVFGWTWKKNGLRRFRDVYVEVNRKNGKSVLAAAIGVYMLVADQEFGAEVYSGATSEKQAWEIFRPARLMCLRSPGLQNYFGLEVNAKNLCTPDDGSRFEPLIGNPGDGASPSCALIDEYHEHSNSDLYDTMETGMGARDQPLQFTITTAGTNIGGPCYEKRVEITKILSGVFKADNVFGIIYTLDKGDDWKDKKVWKKANPNLGVSVAVEYLAAKVAGAIRSPSKQVSVKTKHFGKWLGAKNAFINMEHWEAAADPSLKIEDFIGCHQVLSLDMASKLDLAARIRLFWKDIVGARHYYVFPHFYLPEDALESAKNAKQYLGWAEQGFIELMDGGEISFSQVEADVLAVPDEGPLREFVYDPWQTTQIAQAAREAGMEAVEYRNVISRMSPAMKELEAALAAGRLHHPDNDVYNWNASNLVAAPDTKDNVMPRKELPENKIDGIVATLFAIGRAMLLDDDRGLDDYLAWVSGES